MKYIIGLGNPGLQYELTRHNVAWIIFNEIFEGNEDWKFDKYMNAEYVGKMYLNDVALFIKPQTFMNKSGEVVASLKKQNEFSPENTIIVYDDVDLPFGEIKVSFNRGDGGHNGVKSLTQHIGSKKTIRIRIGVSRILDDGRLIKPNVLSQFPSTELTKIKTILSKKVEEILASLVNYGVEQSMNTFNTKV